MGRFVDYCVFNPETIPGGITLVIGALAMFALMCLPTILTILINTVFLESNLLRASFTIIGMTVIVWIIGLTCGRAKFFKDKSFIIEMLVGLNSVLLFFGLGSVVGILPGYLLYKVAVFFNLTLQNNENLLMLFGIVGILGGLVASWFGIMFFAGMGIALWKYLNRRLCTSELEGRPA